MHKENNADLTASDLEIIFLRTQYSLSFNILLSVSSWSVCNLTCSGLFDQGVDYSSFSSGFTSFTYIVMTQTLVGMGKATFTVVTGNPFVHFITLHVISARVPFDTRMYIEIFKLRWCCRSKSIHIIFQLFKTIAGQKPLSSRDTLSR